MVEDAVYLQKDVLRFRDEKQNGTWHMTAFYDKIKTI